MNFRESESYLLSLGNEVAAMKLGLDNIRTLLNELGDPQNNYLKIQIAGTNGKGSVCAFVGSICREAGISTGIFTSPHLVSVTERIQINGRQITEDEFAVYADKVRDASENLLAEGRIEYRPTFFEQITAIALTAFAGAGVRLAILETGLGGRLDATTAARAEIAAITQIDFDHQEYLGQTLTEIASEKAAIIHDSSAVVVGGQNQEAGTLIRKRLAQLGIEARLGDDVAVEADGSGIRFTTAFDRYEASRLGLAGRHQIENAKVAILLAETLSSYFTVSSHNISAGLANAHHPGRLERQGRFLFDGAHNAAGAAALRAYLDEEIRSSLTIVFAAMREKDIAAVADRLFPKASVLVLTSPDNPRAMPAEELAEFAVGHSDQFSVYLTDRVRDALDIAQELTPGDGTILITGSLYLVGEAKKILNN